MLNLDTHLIIYFLDGTCTDREYTLISQEEIGISSIVLWELAKLTAQGRVSLDLVCRPAQLLTIRRHSEGQCLWPEESASVAEKSGFLTAFGMTAAHKYGKELRGTAD